MEQVVQEMISFEELKEMRISGKKADKMRPGGQTLEAALEAEARRENLNVTKVRSGSLALGSPTSQVSSSFSFSVICSNRPTRRLVRSTTRSRLRQIGWPNARAKIERAGVRMSLRRECDSRQNVSHAFGTLSSVARVDMSFRSSIAWMMHVAGRDQRQSEAIRGNQRQP